jgi:hypothetical protein
VTAKEHARIASRLLEAVETVSKRAEAGELSIDYADQVSNGALRLSQAHSLAAIALKTTRTKS